MSALSLTKVLLFDHVKLLKLLEKSTKSGDVNQLKKTTTECQQKVVSGLFTYDTIPNVKIHGGIGLFTCFPPFFNE